MCLGLAIVLSAGAVVSVCAAGAADVAVLGIVVLGAAGAVDVCANAGAAARRAAAATPPRIFACMLIPEFLSNDDALIHVAESPR